MSWLFSQALVEEYLGASCLDGEQSVPLNGSHIQQAYCAPGKMTDFSRLSQFGMTFKPLTESLGEELLMLYQAGFHAKTSPLQAEEKDLKEKNQVCGFTWQGWLAKLDQDSYLWKIPQCSFIEDSIECLQTFPRWGMTQNGLLWELPILEQFTKGTGSGLWRTPDCGGGDFRLTQTRQESSTEWSTHSNQTGRSSEQPKIVAHTSIEDAQRSRKSIGIRKERDTPIGTGWWASEPRVGRVADGVACRVDRLKAIGNGQVPLVAATAWKLLNKNLDEQK